MSDTIPQYREKGSMALLVRSARSRTSAGLGDAREFIDLSTVCEWSPCSGILLFPILPSCAVNVSGPVLPVDPTPWDGDLQNAVYADMD